MPIEIAGIWLGLGAAMALVILIVAMLIPRPQPEYAISSATGWLSSPERQASQVAPLGGSTGEGESAATSAANAETPLDQEQGERPQPSNAPGEGRSREGGEQAGTIKGSQPPTGTSSSGEKSTPGQQAASSQTPDRSGASTDRSADKQQGKSGQPAANERQQSQQSPQSQDGKREAGQQGTAQQAPQSANSRRIGSKPRKVPSRRLTSKVAERLTGSKRPRNRLASHRPSNNRCLRG